MKAEIMRYCDLLIENRNRVKSVFRFDGGLIHLACAGICTAKGIAVDTAALAKCRDLLKANVGVFSNFRSTARAPIVTMLAVSDSPEEVLKHGLTVYELLKKDFLTSAYLPLVSMIIAQMAEASQYESIAARTRLIYKRMKSEHPFLTSSEDSALCALMALSDKPDDSLLGEAERCYWLMKQHFFSANAVQSLGHVLALCDGAVEMKCRKTLDLFEALRAAGCKYGTGYELPTLGVLAMSGGEPAEIAREIAEIDRWLSDQSGFGFFGSVSGKQRLMYAGIVAMQGNGGGDTLQTAAINGTISLIVAQQAALCAAIAASSAASAASASS